MNRVMINLMSGTGRHSDAVRAKAGTEPARARSLVVPDIKHEIVLHNVIVSAAQIDSLRGPGRRVVIPGAAELVFLDGVGPCRADASDVNTSVIAVAAGRDP